MRDSLPGLAGSASAHPGDHDGVSDGVEQGQHNGTSSGHLPAKQENVRLVGEGSVTPRPSTQQRPEGTSPLEGRIADVNVFGNYAYLASFREPTCDNGGCSSWT